MQAVFEKYTCFGTRDNNGTIDNRRFIKLLKDAKIIDNEFTQTSGDLIWSKIVKKQRKMDWKLFNSSLEELARKKNLPLQTLENMIASIEEPSKTNVTKFADDDWVKRETDVSNYTGIHKYRFDKTGKGLGIKGRTDVNLPQDVKDITDRTAYDIRGRNVNVISSLKEEEKLKENVKNEIDQKKKIHLENTNSRPGSIVDENLD